MNMVTLLFGEPDTTPLQGAAVVLVVVWCGLTLFLPVFVFSIMRWVRKCHVELLKIRKALVPSSK